jgi:hypothetical protein
MSKYTEHLKLVKPEGNEYYNVEQFNHNAELIDKETKKLSEDLAKVQEGATREKSGIVQFGTEEGKALEGMMLARLSGCIGYGGDIQDDIIKNPNYIYYDRNTRKMYKCLKQNQDISANVANFIPLDNNSLLERLENLISSKIERNNSILKIGNVVIENVSIPGGTGIRTATLKTSFKNIISISLTPYITYGQQVDSAQSIHDSSDYIILNKSLRFYCNGNQTIDVCIIGIV